MDFQENKMDNEFDKEEKGKLFVRRVQQVLKGHDNVTLEELMEKIEEMKDLMITLTKMLRHTTQKLKRLEKEKEHLAQENTTILQLMSEMEHHLSGAELNVAKFANKCQQYEDLKNQFEALRSRMSELQEIQKSNELGECDKSMGDSKLISEEKRKSKKTQTHFPKYSSKYLMKFENGLPVFSDYNKNKTNENYDLSLQKLQTFILNKEQTWQQVSGREREQRTKLSRLIKEMKIMQNQLDWKNNQLSFKETEVKEKSQQLCEAERKISELKKYIKMNKRSKLTKYHDSEILL